LTKGDARERGHLLPHGLRPDDWIPAFQSLRKLGENLRLAAQIKKFREFFASAWS
jgi:hypothetical protein